MRVLLTGHEGYIGSVMAPILRAHGHEVVGLDTGYFADCVLGDAPAAWPGARKDVRDALPDDLAGFDAVVHLAALSNDPLGDLHPELTRDINYRASVRLAQLARAAGVRRFVFSSSCSVYGAAGDDLLPETAAVAPITAYAESKIRTEEALMALADDDFSPVMMRNATAYGVSPRLRADLVLNNLVCWAHLTGEVRITSDGSPWRPIAHIGDLSRAFVAVLAAPRETIHNEIFNIGANSANYQVRQLGDIVQATVPGSRVHYAGQGGPDPRNYRVNFSKFARAFPAYRPRWNARTGARELYAAFRRCGLTLEEFQGRKFTRLRQLNHLMETGALDADLRWAIAAVA